MPPLLLPEGTLETVKSECQIFDRPEYQVSQLHGDWLEYKPTADCKGTDVGTPIIFNIPKAEGLYTDLSNSYMLVNFSIVNADDGVIAPADCAKVALVNMGLSSLFRDVAFLVNNVKVEGDSQLYPYKAYLYNLLGASDTCKKYQLGACGWVSDEAEKYDDKTNKGHTVRALWTTSTSATVGKSCTFGGPLFLDCWMQKQYMLDKMNLSFKFTRAPHAFALLEPDSTYTNAAKIKFNWMTLWLRRVQVAPNVMYGHRVGLERQNAIWKYPSFKVITYFHNSGTDLISIPDCTPGIYPKCIFVGMLENSAYIGTYNKNPFNFKHFNVKSLSMMVNGQFVPSTPFLPDWTNENYIREYLSLFLATGRYGIHEDDNGILLKDFAHGCSIFPFTFAPDLSLDGFAQPIRMVNIRLDMHFSKPLPSNVTVMLFCLCDTLFEFTNTNLVLLDNTQLPS